MAYTETTTESWGSRIGNALKGILVGLGLIVASIALLWWNEGRAVKTAQALSEGAENVQSVESNAKVDSAMEGQLVHMSGDAKTDETMTDAKFGISIPGIHLTRKVEYYQWEEEKHTEEHKNAGGSVTKTTTYTYEKNWVSRPINSSNFKEGGHNNFVSYSVEDAEQSAKNVKFGAFKLSDSQIGRIPANEELDLSDREFPEDLTARTALEGNTLYIGAAATPAMVAAAKAEAARRKAEAEAAAAAANGTPAEAPAAETPAPEAATSAVEPAPAVVNGVPVQADMPLTTADPGNPQIGDVRITWHYAGPEQVVSLVAVQKGNTFVSYVAKSSGYKVNLFSMGIKSAEEMFQDAQDANVLMTWILRFVGWFAMFCGLRMVLAPISVVADVLPILGNIAETGISFVCFIVASVISIIVIALAWLFYRPILGICLIAAIVGLVVWYKKRQKAAAPAAAPAPAPETPAAPQA